MKNKTLLILIISILVITVSCSKTEDFRTPFIAELLDEEIDEITEEQLDDVTVLQIVGNHASTRFAVSVPFGKDGYIWNGIQQSWDEQYGVQINEIGVFRNLNELSIMYNSELDSVGFLSSMTELRTLSIRMGSFMDISPIKACKNLESLELVGIESLTDISALESLVNLKYLKISGCSIEDLSPLSKLTNLEELMIIHNRSEISGSDSIKSLDKITTLYLIYPNIDLSFLKNSTVRPQILTVGGGTIDLSVLREISGIANLFIEEAVITDLSPLNECDAGNISLYNCDIPSDSLNTLNDIKISEGLSHYDFYWLIK